MSEKAFFHLLDELDLLILQDAREDTLKRFAAICRSTPVAENYAFTHLSQSTWILALKNSGLLQGPRACDVDEDGNLTGNRNWPQVDYLKRMAQTGTTDTQEHVLGIMLDVGKTSNYWIHRHFTEASLNMPVDLAAKWAHHEIVWLRAGNATSDVVEDVLGQLASKLAKEGDPKAALALAAEILAVFPDPDAEKKLDPQNQAQAIAYSSLEPRIRCDQYHYAQVLEKNIPDIAAAAPRETLALLCDLVEKATVHSLKNSGNSKPHDMSYITRPAIEDHEQNHSFDFQDNLIAALRNVAEFVCRHDIEQLPVVIEMLESREWDIFRRIAMYLLQVFDSAPAELVRERLVDKNLFGYIGVHHEYFHLLRCRFGRLSDEDQNTILEWIDNADERKKRLNEHGGDLTEEQRGKQIRSWQYRNLQAVQEFLSGEWRVRFQKLEDEFGDSEIPADFHSFMSATWSGPESPKTEEELARLSKHELIQYLKEWKPSGDWMAASPAGLGTVLGDLIEKEPEEYAEIIDQFMDDDLDPTYINHLIQGFCRVVEGGMPIPFEDVFRLCQWVVDKTTEIVGREIPKNLRDNIEMDSDWGNTKREIARLSEKVFSEKLELPYALREKVWAIIEPLTRDPAPNREYEEKYGGDNMDPLTLSINTTRGKAMHSVMCYAMWVCREIKKNLQNESQRPDLTEMPEVRAVLDAHLDTSVQYGSCQTDRAVYGQRLPQLVSLDKKWVEDNINRIFPAEEDLRDLRLAAWHSYLMYSSSLYQNVVKLVRGIYAEEVELLKGKEIKDDAYKTLDTRLAEHVLLFYCWGDATLDEGDLVDRFFRVASPVLTKHAMDFLGRYAQGKGTLSDEEVGRLKDLWDWRVQMCGGIENMPEGELSAFGWWFAVGHFDPSWAFRNLEAVLARTGVSRSNRYVFEYMSSIFGDYPKESLRCVRLFMGTNDDPWFFASTTRQKGIWTILEQGLQHPDAEIRSESESIVHLLGSMGRLEYRDLLKTAQPPEED